jgi:hydroxyethylthiazole kinase-like uncharacterized protein yjeF
MLAAGTVAASTILDRWPDQLRLGALVFAGAGNNGGDAYVVGAQLLAAGVSVSLETVGEPRSEDARRAKAMYDAGRAACVSAHVSADVHVHRYPTPGLVIDGVLGTGQQGALRAPERRACDAIAEARARGSLVVALDVPTGVNTTTGNVAEGAVVANHTLAFGTMKRAHVLERGYCGRVIVLDIGLGAFAERADGAWEFAGPTNVGAMVPRIAWNAYKGTRGRLAIVGGNHGMAGAVVLASRAALRSGAGLVFTHTAAESANVLQVAVPQAVARSWPDQPNQVRGAAIGPGFGRDARARRELHAALDATDGVPTVLDADALTLLATSNESRNDIDESLDDRGRAARTIATVRAIAASRPLVCTPHVGEFARLIGTDAAGTLEGRIAQATEFIRATGITLLLKGTPTVVLTPDGAPPTVVARGTSVLATGGSGDLLTGLIGALLAQGASPRDAAITGAWVHGRAAELATDDAGVVRGVTLDEVLHALPRVWRELGTPEALPVGVLAELPEPR